MNRNAMSLYLLGSIFVLFLTPAKADSGVPTPADFCRDWFGQAAQAVPLTLCNTNVVVQEVTLDGRPSGWLFRTDQVPPFCKGKRGQIAVLVAIGTDAHIKGLTVLAHKEDPRYFQRLKKTFFDQFRNRHADEDLIKFDAVTKATFSSRAIIRDVMEGTRTVIAQPEVAAKLLSGKKGG